MEKTFIIVFAENLRFSIPFSAAFNINFLHQKLITKEKFIVFPFHSVFCDENYKLFLGNQFLMKEINNKSCRKRNRKSKVFCKDNYECFLHNSLSFPALKYNASLTIFKQ
jgi:hypothetical protein